MRTPDVVIAAPIKINPVKLTQLAKRCARLTGFFVLVSGFAATSGLVGVFTRDVWIRRRQRAKVISLYSKWTLRLFGVNVRLVSEGDGCPHLTDENPVGGTYDQAFLYVSNHLGYLDVLVVSAFFPSVFVTSVEIRDTPFLGFLSRLGGCVYVERRNRDRLSTEVKELVDGLHNAVNICIFPEATSTSGESVLRFRRPLFQSAIDSAKPVAPMALNYTSVDGQQVSAANRDTFAWYGDMAFFPHLWNLIGSSRVDVEITVTPPLSAHEFSDVTALSEAAHSRVSAHYRAISPE